MPAGFIILSLVLIYELFFENKAQVKCVALIFCIFVMSGYFINPLHLGNLSVNIVMVISALVLMCYFAKNFRKTEKINFLICGIIVVLSYIIITNISTDFISILNPYPIFFVIMLLGVISIKNISFVISFSMLSFLLLSVCNLFVESGLGYVNFANVELFNLILVGVVILCGCRFVLCEFNLLKKDIVWKSL